MTCFVWSVGFHFWFLGITPSLSTPKCVVEGAKLQGTVETGYKDCFPPFPAAAAAAHDAQGCSYCLPLQPYGRRWHNVPYVPPTGYHQRESSWGLQWAIEASATRVWDPETQLLLGRCCVIAGSLLVGWSWYRFRVDHCLFRRNIAQFLHKPAHCTSLSFLCASPVSLLACSALLFFSWRRHI